MIKYQIEDRQICGRLFGDGELFDTKDEVREQLISYHLTDMETADIEKFKKFTLDEILEFGEWELQEVEVNNCPYCKSDFVISEGHNCDIGRAS